MVEIYQKNINQFEKFYPTLKADIEKCGMPSWLIHQPEKDNFLIKKGDRVFEAYDREKQDKLLEERKEKELPSQDIQGC